MCCRRIGDSCVENFVELIDVDIFFLVIDGNQVSSAPIGNDRKI